MRCIGTTLGIAAIAASLTVAAAFADDDGDDNRRRAACGDVPSHTELKAALAGVVGGGGNAGLGNDMWATVVNRDGVVCAVVFSGSDRGDQWPGSRVISAQKANTANAFSLPAGSGGISGLALSTANLYSAVQPGGSLFGLQESNPVDPDIAYRGNANRYGENNDPMAGWKIGGVNVFGGGLGLYSEGGELVGAIGASGDTSCADHIIAWKVRDALGLDFVPAGVSPTGDDNMILDTTADPATGHTVSDSGFGHPSCGFGEDAIIADLPNSHATSPIN